MRLIAMLQRRTRDERGFTMLTVMSVMFVVTLLSIAALSAAQNDIRPGEHDTARKVAYAAAEAGVQNYLYHLSQDLDYWTKCTNVAAPNAVNNAWNGAGSDPRTWSSLPGSSARYTIELLPVGGAAACDPANAVATMIDTDTGTFKIRATGEDRTGGLKRSIVATFRRKSLLDYLYFTDKETWSPDLYAVLAPDSREDGVSPARNLQTWAATNCDRYWGDDPSLGGRNTPTFSGELLFADGTWHHTSIPAHCQRPGFSSNEVVAGPLHTNDEIFSDCPTAQFGNSPDDAIETSSLGQPGVTEVDPQGGFQQTCSASQTHVNLSTNTSPDASYGTSLPRSASLELPLTNNALLADTDATYRFKGTTQITMHGTTMHVKGTRMDGTSVDSDMAIPPDGVVYVANDGTCAGYSPVDSDAPTPGCGNLKVAGDYSANVTLTAENDIVVTGDLKRTSSSSNFLLGLIATNYVRVAHPVTGCDPEHTCNRLSDCHEPLSTPDSIAIDGVILSLNRSFIVDNWFCGDKDRGDLIVKGAIAQKYHGPVGDKPAHAGYQKQFTYDEQLRYRSPPHFLDPVNAQWHVRTFSEQVPAR
jgi:type II secretory pathway pseudopilin PulG